MKIADILAKVAKGEALTDPEKEFVKAFDPDKAADDAAAGARKKAEAERDAVRAELDALKRKADDDGKKGLSEIEKLTATVKELNGKVNDLTKAKAEAEARAAAVKRSQDIRDAAKAAGITLAPKTVSESLFFQMLEAQLSKVDITDKAALDAAMAAFKTDNPGIIAAPGGGTGGAGGEPGKGGTAKNPWAKDSFNVTEQIQLLQSNPDLARSMAAQHGVTI